MSRRALEALIAEWRTESRRFGWRRSSEYADDLLDIMNDDHALDLAEVWGEGYTAGANDMRDFDPHRDNEYTANPYWKDCP